MFSLLAKSIREYKRDSVLTSLFVIIELIIECLIPFLISKTVNTVKAGADMKEILTYGGILIVMAVISLTCGVLAGNFCASASCGFARNLRRDMYYKIQNYSFANIDKFSTSSLVTRMTTDVNFVQEAYMMLIRIAVRAPLMMIFAFIMAFVMGGKMAVIFVFVVPVLAFVLFLVARKAMPLFHKVFAKYDKLNASVQENIKGMRVVKSFVREDFEQKKFDAAADDVCRDFTKAERIIALNGPTMQFCMYSVMLFVLYFGSKIIIESRGLTIDVGEFSAMLTYSFMILSNLMMVSMILVILTLSAESARRIAEVLSEESTVKNPENPVYEVNDGSIKFEDVSFRYTTRSKRTVLKNISLEIKSGETVGVIGGTGSSKSSLVSLISRLYDVTEGSIKVGGLDVRDYDIETLRDSVAVVLQKNVLFSGTIKENLRWGKRDATDEEIKEACTLACADEFIDTFKDGYDTYIEQGGANVSGGQKQRLCIARALLKRPKILILDDSTSAVDTRTDAKIRAAMRRFIPDTTKIIIAQRTASVEDADRIIVMDAGNIIAEGSHKELLSTCSVYREIYESQNKAGGDDCE